MPKYPGVRKKRNKWYYRFQYKGASIEQGSFDSAEEAHKAPPRAPAGIEAPQAPPDGAHRQAALREVPRGARASVQPLPHLHKKRGDLQESHHSDARAQEDRNTYPERHATVPALLHRKQIAGSGALHHEDPEKNLQLGRGVGAPDSKSDQREAPAGTPHRAPDTHSGAAKAHSAKRPSQGKGGYQPRCVRGPPDR
jgi:hypothetical protein